MKPEPKPHQIRAAIAREAKALGIPLCTLSRVLGCSDRYIQRHIKEGRPEMLSDDDRARLARFMGVDAAEFGTVAYEATRRPRGRR